MARRARGTIYRKVRRNRKERFYRVRYRDADRNPQDHVIILPGGGKVTDRSVADRELDRILKGIERKQAGPVDDEIENVRLPMMGLVARYIRRHRRKWSRAHTEQVVQQWRWLIDHRIERLGDFQAERLEEVLDVLANTGVSPRTVNSYRCSAHTLGAWAVKVGRILQFNPVDAVALCDKRADTRKVRRSPTLTEASRLLDVAPPRRLFYHLSAWTGLRVSEVRALQWWELELDGDRPCIRLRAEATKSRRADELPIHPDLVMALSESKPGFASPTDRVFKSVPILRTFKTDLARARIPVEDERGRTLDRHALRTTFISWLWGCTGWTLERRLPWHATARPG